MNFREADVTKALAAGSKVLEAGNRVVLDTDRGGSYIENKKTGKCVPLRIENGVFVFDVWIFPSKTKSNIKSKDEVQLAPMQEEMKETDPSSFPRRVRWP